MPAAFERCPRGKVNLVFTCEECGQPAHYGYGASILRAFNKKDLRQCGRWFCKDHKPKETGK